MAEAIKTMSESLGESGTKTSAVVSASLMQGTSFLAQSLRQGTKITTSFLHDAVQVALDRDSGGDHEEAHEEPLPPLSVPTSWAPRADTGAASSGDAERLLALAAETEACIVQGLAECDRRAREIREAKVFGELGAAQDGASLPEGAQGVLTRVLACLRFPRTPGSPEETEPWEADGCRLVREWAARVDGADAAALGAEAVAEAETFLESAAGKDALMAGFHARMQVINMHPFYHRTDFARAAHFESWKVGELESLEQQKGALARHTRSEVQVAVLGARVTPRPRSPRAAAPPADARGGPGVDAARAAAEAAASKVQIAASKAASLTSRFGTAFLKSPVQTSVKASMALVAAPVSAAASMAKARGDVWWVLSFAAHEHRTGEVLDAGPDAEEIALTEGDAGTVTWEARQAERGAVCVQMWERVRYALGGVAAHSGGEYLRGTLLFAWEDLEAAAALHQPIEGWFTCDDGSYDERGERARWRCVTAASGQVHVRKDSRDLLVRVALVTRPIDGTATRPLFDPSVRSVLAGPAPSPIT